MPLPTGAPPLAALKQWLGVTTAAEDALIERLLLASWQTCERFVADDALGEGWEDIPPALAEGIIRFAAHLHAERGGAAQHTPPAAVAALWRPYRAVRL